MDADAVGAGVIYRVEIRRDGSVASCTVVESTLADSGHVFYVDSTSKEAAIRSAKKLHARMLVLNNARREAALAAGLCQRCMKRAADQGLTQCARCRSREKKRHEAAKLRGAQSAEEVAARIKRRCQERAERMREMGKKGRQTSVQARMAQSDAFWDGSGSISPTYRVALRQCLRAFDRDPASFRAWLLRKLGQEPLVTAAE